MKRNLKEDDGGKMEYLKALEDALEAENYLCTYNDKKLIVDTDLGMFDIDYVPGEWVYVIHFSGPNKEFTKYKKYTDDVVELIVNVVEDQLDDWSTEHYIESKKPIKKGIKEDRSLGRTPKPYKAVERGTTVLERDGEPWTVIEKGTVSELNEKYPECQIYERPYYDAVYVGDNICQYGHEDRGKHIFVYGEHDDVYNNVLAYYDDGPSRSWSVYMRESRNLKEGDVEDGWCFIFGSGNYSVYQRGANEYKVEWSDGVCSIEPILCSSEEEAKQIVEELQDAEK